MFHIGGSRTFLKDTSKKPSGWTKNMAGDTTPPAMIPLTAILSSPLISILDLSSGELLENFLTTEDLQLNDLHQSNWDFASTTRKELTEAIGGHWTGKKTKRKNSPEAHSSLEVITKKFQTKISKSLPQTQQQQLKSNLNSWLATFPPMFPLPNSHHLLSIRHQHWLMQWPQSQQLPLSLQQLYWAELLDLQYPLTPLEADHLCQDLLEEEEDIGQVEALLGEDHQDHQDHQDLLEEGEIMEEENL
jgi:hypothetical protein